MASRSIRGITIQFGADTGKLQKAFSEIKNKTNKVTKNLRDMNKLMKFNPKNIELMSQKQSELAKQINLTSEKLNVLKNMQKDLKARGIDENSDEFKALRREIIDTEKALDTYNNQLKEVETSLKISTSKMGKISQSFSKFGKNLQNMGDKIKNVSQSFSQVGQKLTIGLTLPIVGIGVASIKAGSDFEKGMSEVQAISGATSNDMKALEKIAKEMGRTTKFSAADSAEGLKYMAMAGWETHQMVSALPGVMNLAAASGEELGVVSDILTDALSAFKMEAKDANKFADLLAKTSSSANTNVSILGESFKYVAPVAGALGYTAEDTALALSVMANAGIKSSQSGTTLKNTLARMAKPTADVSSAMKDLGISLTNNQGEMKPLNNLIKEMRSKFKRLTKEQKAQYAASLAGKEGMAGLLVLMGANEDEFKKLEDATRNYNGAAKEMADIMENNLQGKVTKLKSALEGVAIDGFKAMIPSLEKVVEKIQGAVKWFSELDQESKENIIRMVAIVAAAGPLLSIIGKVGTGIGVLIKGIGILSSGFGTLTAGTVAAGGGFSGLATAVGASTTSFLAAAAPIAAIVAGVTAVTFAGYKLYKHLTSESIPAIELFGEEVSNATKKSVGSFLELDKEATNSLNELNWSGQSVTTELKDNLVGKFSEMKKQIVEKLNEQKEESKKVLEDMFNESATMKEQEKQEILKQLDETYSERISKTTESEALIKEILDKASQDKRELTTQEKETIGMLRNQMKEEGIRALSESEEEYKVILQRIADQGAEISAKGAAEVVKNSLEQKNKTIENANKEYDERIKYAEQIRAQGGIKAEETANKIIEEAKKQKDGAIFHAEEMHNNVVEHAKEQAKEHIKEIDWEKGETKSKWNVMLTTVVDSAKVMWEGASKWINYIGNTLYRVWSWIEKITSRVWNGISQTITSNIRGAWETVSSIVGRMGDALSSVGNSIAGAGSWIIDKIGWHSEGGIFTRPTILPSFGGKLHGFAEPSTGGEAIMPLNKLSGLMASAIEEVNQGKNQTIVNHIYLNGKEIAREVTNNVESNLNTRVSRTNFAGGFV